MEGLENSALQNLEHSISEIETQYIYLNLVHQPGIPLAMRKKHGLVPRAEVELVGPTRSNTSH